VIDYAGLFPPAALPMPRAVENYARYRMSPESWMLGRFVVPVSRLDEFEASIGHAALPLVSALIGADLESDLDRIARSPFSIDAVELKAADAEQIKSAMRRIPSRLTPYFEITSTELIPAIRDAGARAKIRTGGITPEAFPTPEAIAQFLATCSEHGVAFKATAGLHHPLRCYRPLTYAADGHSGWMFGFLNVFAAAVLARLGVVAGMLKFVLLEESADAFTFNDAQMAWSGHVLNVGEIVDTRREFAISFGSCSFEEPVADLKSLGLL
jgi:hypothetical protein